MKTTTKTEYKTMTEAIRAELMRLSDPNLKGKELVEEIGRATAMAYLAQSAVNVGKFELNGLNINPDQLVVIED